MKTLFFSVLALTLSGAALAEIPEIRSNNVTCQELQDAVRNYGEVTVVTKKFLSKKRLLVSQEKECGEGLVKKAGVFKTKDVSECLAGVYCAAEHVIVVIDHEPRPRHDRWTWRTRHPRPTPTPHPLPRPDRPHRPERPIPSHTNPGPRYNPRPDRPSHERPSRPERPSHDRPSRSERPSHDRPSHDRPSRSERPSHDRPSHDRPSRDHGCRGRSCIL